MDNSITMKQAALEYAAHGISVFPLEPGSMHPLEDGRDYPATINQELIERWWSENPDYNIGHPIGKGIAVIDLRIEPWKKNQDGIKAFEEYVQMHGPLPKTASCSIEFGGRRLFYRVKSPFRGNYDVCPGISIQSYRNYIMLPPSVTYRGAYRWEDQSMIDGINRANAAVWELISTTAEEKGYWKPHGEVEYLNPDELQDYLVVPECGRDVFLSGAIDHLKFMGYSQRDIEKIVRELNQKHCDPPYTKDELRDEVFEEGSL